jgi:glycosyltransferase involved in cell wall biosynthesis
MSSQADRPHVLAVVEQFWHREPGGTATATEQTLAALAASEEFRLTGLAARHSPPGQQEQAPWQRMPAGSYLQFDVLPRPLLYEAWLRLGRPSIDRYCEPGSVVWASSLIVPPTEHPVVATVHDLDFLANSDRVGVRVRRFFSRMWRRARDRADLLVCPSHTVADDCRRRGVPPHRLAVVPWGVAPPRCDPDRAQRLLRDLQLAPGYVLWVGPLSPRKNARRAAHALGRVDTPVVAVVSGGDHPSAVAAWASLGSRVRRFTGVDEETLSALYRGAGLLFYPSLAEGFGLPVVEAMAHGTPVVTSAGTATEEMAAGAAALVDPGDPDAMAEVVQAVLCDGSLRRRLIEGGLSRASNLTWDATAKGYAEAFRSVR